QPAAKRSTRRRRVTTVELAALRRQRQTRTRSPAALNPVRNIHRPDHITRVHMLTDPDGRMDALGEVNRFALVGPVLQRPADETVSGRPTRNVNRLDGPAADRKQLAGPRVIDTHVNPLGNQTLDPRERVRIALRRRRTLARPASAIAARRR